MNPKFFLIAQKASYHSDHHQHKIGAVLVKKGAILSFGYNQCKTHPRSKTRTIHAELKAILKANESVSGGEMYTFRERKDGKLGMSRPCPVCLSLLTESEIIAFHYTTPEGFRSERCL